MKSIGASSVNRSDGLFLHLRLPIATWCIITHSVLVILSIWKFRESSFIKAFDKSEKIRSETRKKVHFYLSSSSVPHLDDAFTGIMFNQVDPLTYAWLLERPMLFNVRSMIYILEYMIYFQKCFSLSLLTRIPTYVWIDVEFHFKWSIDA